MVLESTHVTFAEIDEVSGEAAWWQYCDCRKPPGPCGEQRSGQAGHDGAANQPASSSVTVERTVLLTGEGRLGVFFGIPTIIFPPKEQGTNLTQLDVV